jgi:type I restriction enzyme, S subunit
MTKKTLPLGWLITKISDIIQPRSEKVSPSDFPHLKFLGMDDIEPHTMRIIGSKSAGEMKSNAACFYSGDVLYGRLRP